MDDIFDTFDWEDMGMIGGMVEEFTEDEMELLGIEKDNDEWKMKIQTHSAKMTLRYNNNHIHGKHDSMPQQLECLSK